MISFVTSQGSICSCAASCSRRSVWSPPSWSCSASVWWCVRTNGTSPSIAWSDAGGGGATMGGRMTKKTRLQSVRLVEFWRVLSCGTGYCECWAEEPDIAANFSPCAIFFTQSYSCMTLITNSNGKVLFSSLHWQIIMAHPDFIPYWLPRFFVPSHFDCPADYVVCSCLPS